MKNKRKGEILEINANSISAETSGHLNAFNKTLLRELKYFCIHTSRRAIDEYSPIPKGPIINAKNVHLSRDTYVILARV